MRFSKFAPDNQPSFFYLRDTDGHPVGAVSLVLVKAVGGSAGALFRASVSAQHPNDPWIAKKCVDKAVGKLLAKQCVRRGHGLELFAQNVLVNGSRNERPSLELVLKDMGFGGLMKRVNLSYAGAMWNRQLDYLTARALGQPLPPGRRRVVKVDDTAAETAG